MLKRHTVTFHHNITILNDMFDHMDGVSRAFATKQTQWKEDLYLSMTLVRLRLPNNHAERTPTMGKLLMSACIIDPVRKL